MHGTLVAEDAFAALGAATRPPQILAPQRENLSEAVWADLSVLDAVLCAYGLDEGILHCGALRSGRVRPNVALSGARPPLGARPAAAKS